MRRDAIGALFIAVAAVVALVAWGAVQGDGGGGAAEGDEPQRQGWAVPAALLLDQERRVVADGTQTPAPSRQVSEATDIEQQPRTGEAGASVPTVSIVAPITFYACYGPNGGYCAGPVGPLPLAEGQAACGEAWPMGAVVVIEGDPLGPVVCNDRGWLAPYQVDRFFWHEEDGWAWSAQIGGYARVERVGMRRSTP